MPGLSAMDPQKLNSAADVATAAAKDIEYVNLQ